MVERNRFWIVFGVMLAAAGCDVAANGETAKELYSDVFHVQSPEDEYEGPTFGESTRPRTASEDHSSEGAETLPSDDSDLGAEDEPPASGASASFDDDSDKEPPNKYCGDGVCGEGESESCWIDCSPPPQTTEADGSDNASADDDAPGATPASGPEPNSETPANDGSGPWSCVQAQCAFEWGMCMSDPACAALHQCMLSCPGNEACKDQCLSDAGSLASLKLDDVAFCAAIMGCI